MSTDYSSISQRYAEAGQSHVFEHWDKMSEASQKRLLTQAAQVDLNEIQTLSQKIGSEAPTNIYADLCPPSYEAHYSRGGNASRWAHAVETGETALRNGRVAAFTVAGGQGTRLGFDGPKGTFPITPIRRHTLFQHFADKIHYAQRRYASRIPWFIMTSEINHEATIAYFESNQYFGLEVEDLHFFKQGLMPAVDLNGKIILESADTIAMSPDGHGGSLRALVRSGAVEKMEAYGTDIISYFQVDNPLVQCIDPAFIGFHIEAESDMSSKMLPKAYPDEKLGVFCIHEGKLQVIEYSDLPEILAEQREDDGSLKFKAGSIAIHILNRDFVKQVGGTGSHTLPFHLAHKKVPFLSNNGETLKPDAPNGIKFEMFVFDALPFARNPIVIETSRELEFSPVKNAKGVDSPQSSQESLVRLHASWLSDAGVKIKADKNGLPLQRLEICPRVASDSESFRKYWQALAEKPKAQDSWIID